MKGRLGSRLLGVFGLAVAAVSAAWGAGLFDRPTPPPGTIASTDISITVGKSWLFDWSGQETAAAGGVLLGVVLLTAAVALAVRGRRRTAGRLA